MLETPHDPQVGARASPDDLSEPLSRRSRALALVLGVVAAGVGGYAVLASENQAGTAVLLLVGAALLLLAIQGTPIRSFGGGEYKIELDRLRRRVAEAASQAARLESPEVAAAVADAITSIDPGLGTNLTAALYEQSVLQAVRRTGASVDPAHRAGPGDQGVDVRAQVAGGGRVNVEVRYRRRGALGSRDIATAAAKFRASGFDGGFLLVTNAPLSAEAQEHNAGLTHGRQVPEVITWNDDREDDLLARALTRNAR